MTRWVRSIVLPLVMMCFATPALAQIRLPPQPPRPAQPPRSSIQLGAGLFLPRGLDARADDDVLARNIIGEPMPVDPSVTDALAFEIGDFRSGLVFGEYSYAATPQIEVSIGVSAYGRTVPTLYADVVDENTGVDIEQEISLRVMPISGIVRFIPVGRPGEVQPYFGGGISFLNFRYKESGEFVDPFTFDIFDDEFEATGTALGGVVLGGVRIPLGRRGTTAMSFEGRYQFGAGDIGGPDDDFLTDTIDLGGAQLNAGFLFRF